MKNNFLVVERKARRRASDAGILDGDTGSNPVGDLSTFRVPAE